MRFSGLFGLCVIGVAGCRSVPAAEPAITPAAYTAPPALIKKFTDVDRVKGISRPPHVYSLGGLSEEQVGKLRTTPGVKDVKVIKNRVRVVYQPYSAGKRITVEEAKTFCHGILAVKKQVGKTKWTHGGITIGGRPVFTSHAQVMFALMFNDGNTGHNEAMRIKSFPDIGRDMVEHEMLRYVLGTKVSVIRCGKGYAIVSRASRGTLTVWQPTPQQYVRIDNSFDRKMVAAYIERLGSITPKRYKVNLDKWVVNEIRWRLVELNDYYVKWGVKSTQPHSMGVDLLRSFPEIRREFGTVRRNDPSLEKKWSWLRQVGHFLWANRKNFKYDDWTRGYVLKGPDLYDPAKPPTLPQELQPPPMPEAKKKFEDVKRQQERPPARLKHKKPDE